MADLQVMNMQTSSPVKSESLLDRIINGIVDGAALITLTGMVFAIWFIAGYLTAHM